jgi:hypothetical protein
MKKFLCFAMFVFAMSYNVFALETGGAARLTALGSPELVVVDSSNGIDLYGNGFISAIFMRPKENTLTFYPSIDYSSFKTVPKNPTDYTTENSSVGAGNAFVSTPLDSGFVVYPTDKLVLIFKPYAYYNTNLEKDIYPSSSEDKRIGSNYMYAGEFAAALKLSPGLAISLLGGYTRHGVTFRDATDPASSDYASYNTEYEASASFLPEAEGGFTFAVTAGNKKKNIDPMQDFKASSGFTEMELSEILLSGQTLRIYQLDDADSKTLTFNAIEYNLNMMHVDFALSNVKSDGNGLSAVLGLKSGPVGEVDEYSIYKDRDSGKETQVKEDKVSLSDMYGALGSLEFRTNTGAFETGIKFDFDWTHFNKMFSGDGINNYNIKAVSGINLTAIKNLQVPFEIYYENSTFYDTQNNLNKIYDMGFTLGTEFDITKEFSLRFGGDYGFLGILEGHSLPGTQNNPFSTKLGVNAGVGFKTASAETNITLRFETRGTNPTDESYSSYSDNVIKLLADVKFAL